MNTDQNAESSVTTTTGALEDNPTESSTKNNVAESRLSAEIDDDKKNKIACVSKGMTDSFQKAYEKLDDIEKTYIEAIHSVIDKKRHELAILQKGLKKDELEQRLRSSQVEERIDKSDEDKCGAKVRETPGPTSDLENDNTNPPEITRLRPAIKYYTDEVTHGQPSDAEEQIGNNDPEFLAVQATAKLKIPEIVCLFNEPKWDEIKQIKTDLSSQSGMRVDKNGDIVVSTSSFNSDQIKVFSSSSGDLKTTFRSSLDGALQVPDIAITHDNHYLVPGDCKILFYHNQGYLINTYDALTNDVNNVPAKPCTLDVDSHGRIIAGLYGNTISIHQQNGRFISRFSTEAFPTRLAVTSKDEIVVNESNLKLCLLDYCGNTIREIKPPERVIKWEPWHLCCSNQGEVFVVNGGDMAVYRFTADGDACLRCVIEGLDDPDSIAISDDGQQLFIAEHAQEVIKIF